jgi:hypothetical protein
MRAAELATYLNDHLAGSVGALDLLDHLARESDAGEEVSFFQALHQEIAAEQAELRELLRELGGEESNVRKAARWVAEKVTRLKLRWDDPGDDGLRRFEALEALALGITGKASLWRTLAAVSSEVPALQRVDLESLQRRSEDQYAAVERRRLAAAREAFTAPG